MAVSVLCSVMNFGVKTSRGDRNEGDNHAARFRELSTLQRNSTPSLERTQQLFGQVLERKS